LAHLQELPLFMPLEGTAGARQLAQDRVMFDVATSHAVVWHEGSTTSDNRYVPVRVYIFTCMHTYIHNICLYHVHTNKCM
jgi:hypothetical protein